MVEAMGYGRKGRRHKESYRQKSSNAILAGTSLTFLVVDIGATTTTHNNKTLHQD
jgi:hypothetical protein